MPRKLDLSGHSFGMLTASSQTRAKSGRRAWVCRCECGGTTTVTTDHLKSGHTKSCGCLFIKARMAPASHGHSTNGVSPTYRSWAGMLGRCRNKSNKVYGGRGVSVCDRWRSFESFLGDMGECPSGMSIDRLNNDLGYSPENCKWSNRLDQSSNRRTTRWYEAMGKRLPIADWCRELGLNYSMVYGRLQNGWGIEEALRTPSRSSNE